MRKDMITPKRLDCCSAGRLDLDLLVRTLLLLPRARVGLRTHDAAAPSASVLLVLFEVAVLDSRHDLGQLGLVFAADLGDGECGGSLALHVSKMFRLGIGDSTYLLVYDRAQTSLALDNRIRHTHLPAQRRQEDDQLNRITVVRDQHQRSLLRLNERHNVVEPILDRIRLLAHILLLLAFTHSRGLLVQTFLLVRLGLGSVLVEELEELRGSVAIESVAELRNRWWDLQAHVEDFALALETDVRRPFHHAREVATGLDVLTDAEVLGAALDQGVLVLSAKS